MFLLVAEIPEPALAGLVACESGYAALAGEAHAALVSATDRAGGGDEVWFEFAHDWRYSRISSKSVSVRQRSPWCAQVSLSCSGEGMSSMACCSSAMRLRTAACFAA